MPPGGERGGSDRAPAEAGLDGLRELVRARVAGLPGERIAALGMDGATLVAWLHDRIAASFASGRAARVILGSGRWEHLSSEAREWYLERVLQHALQEIPGLTMLAAGEQGAWERLRDWLRGRAYPLVARLVVSEASATEVEDFVQVACLTIGSKLDQFPCDAPFDAWLMVILRNTVLAQVMRSRDLLDREAGVASLDRRAASPAGELPALEERLPDDAQGAQFHRVELRLLLAGAVARLQSEHQRRTLHYTYFEELPDREIARRLGTTAGNVAQLRLRALRRLRSLLGGEWGQEWGGT